MKGTDDRKNSIDKVIIETTDVFGDKVILSERCYDHHTNPERTSVSDVDTREKSIRKGHFEETLKKPRFVYKDKENPNTRHRYFRIFDDQDISEHLMASVVIVDHDRDPKQVATWMVKRRLDQEYFKGGIIYDSERS